jgi:hypothetical protein
MECPAVLALAILAAYLARLGVATVADARKPPRRLLRALGLVAFGAGVLVAVAAVRAALLAS